MNMQMKTVLILIGTFLLGGVLGALLLGSIRGEREAAREEIGRPGGGGRYLVERVIQPRDEEQRRAVMQVLRKWRVRHQTVLEETHRRLREGFDSMRVELDPLLDEEQRERLAEEAERLRRHPPPHRPPGRGRPPSQ